MLRVLPALLLCLALAGCGPKTIVSSLFPTRYAVTTAIDFNDNGQVTRQTVVTGCKVVDQTDSIAANTNTEVTGERHWIVRADGSLWVIGLLDACRWGPKGPRGDRAAKPFRVDPPYEQRDASWRVGRSYTYRFDNAASPTQMNAYDTSRLFVEGTEGLRLSGRLAAGGGKPTDTLGVAFPFLAQADAKAAEIDASMKDQPYDVRAAAPVRPGRFSGYRVMAYQLRNKACPAPDPAAPGPIPLDRTADCQFGNECGPRTHPDQPCKITLGGLRPDFAPGYAEIRYTLAHRDRAFLHRLMRVETLVAAGAPRRNAPSFEWNPRICLDGMCFEPDRTSGAHFYYPRQNIVLDVIPEHHDASGRLFLAQEGPVWSGMD